MECRYRTSLLPRLAQRALDDMQQTLKRLVRLTAGYSLITLVGPLFTILLTPLYTHALSPADYGVVDIALTLAGLVAAIVTVGVDQALGAFFFDGDATHQRNLVTTGAIFGLVSGILAAVVIAALAVPLAELLFNNAGYALLMYVLALGIATRPFQSVLGSGLRLKMDVKRVNILGLVTILATVVINIWLVLVLGMKATGIIAGATIIALIAAVLSLFLARDLLRGSFLRREFDPLIRAGAGLLPGTLSYMLLANVDRLLLTQYVPPYEIGLYSIANKLVSMLWVLLSAVWTAWFPLALEIGNQPDAARQYARIFELFTAGSLMVALAIGIFSPEILTIFARDVYVPASSYALALMITGPVGLMGLFFQIGLYRTKKTHLVSVAVMIAAVVNILVNLWLNPTLGVWGAVIGTIVGIAVATGFQLLFSQRAMYIDYRWIRLTALFIGYLVLMVGFLLIPAINTIPIKIGSMLLFACLPLAVGIVSPAQIAAAVAAVRQRLSGAA